MTKMPTRFPVGLDRLQRGAREPGAELLRPQRPLHEAARDAARHKAPSGIGLDSQAVRSRMVERIAAGGVRCAPVLDALGKVPRHLFVDTALATQAYEDTSLPIGHRQTISKPSVVARMLELLFGGETARTRGNLGAVLEIGTGCGYQAALLALLAPVVVSIERLKPLHDKARANLAGWRAGDIRLLHGDGRIGHEARAPYDSILAAAGGDELPRAWLEQLAEGGRLVAPMHEAEAGGQSLLVIDKRGGRLLRQRHDAVHFVPLKSGTE
ncbi:MAG: protein-L-isoaspartate(D-aspartate) O-methyltransferase [Burkholderiales bacterium]|nr:protein-L-isoaspartate(D-aspartate) O-methyltransferase [Burkholderiales bacterium]